MRKTLYQRFMEMSRLYHFTDFNTACKIIESGRLRYGRTFKLNDLIESNRVVFQRVLSSDLEDENIGAFAEDEMRRYQQISFSQDRDYNGKYFMGFDLHIMWGLYADKGYGACLVFNKEKLNLAENDYARDVHYYDIIVQDFDFRNKSRHGIKAEVLRRRDDIFFKKRKEWEYEQEYRVIRRARNETDEEYLDVSEALSFIIICKDYSVHKLESMFDSDHFHDINSLHMGIPVLTYEYGIDGYSLFQSFMNPIWTEQRGYM